MALHTELPIYRTGVRLLDLAVKAQVQMPRALRDRLSAESHKRNKKAGDTKTWAISSTGPDTCRLWRLL